MISFTNLKFNLFNSKFNLNTKIEEKAKKIKSILLENISFDLNNHYTNKNMHYAIKSLECLKLDNFFSKYIKIINGKSDKLKVLLKSQEQCKALIKAYKNENLHLKDLMLSNKTSRLKEDRLIQIRLYEIQQHYLENALKVINKFKKDVENEALGNEELLLSYESLPKYLKEAIFDLARIHTIDNFKNKIRENVQKMDTSSSLFVHLEKMLGSSLQSYSTLIDIERGVIFDLDDGIKQSLIKSITLNDEFFHKLPQIAKNPNLDDPRYIYDVSVDRLRETIQDKLLNKPIHVAMVGFEYAGLVKAGGLAEALEGMSVGLKKQNPDNKISLVFPKYNPLIPEIERQLTAFTVHKSSKGEDYRVYELEVDGVHCFFIEHPDFELSKKDPKIYGPDSITVANRVASFCDLASDLLYEQQNIDVIHLHDWHVSAVSMLLKERHPEEWANGKTPPVLFTFHNHQRGSQGRVSSGAYCYDPIVKAYQSRDISKGNDNLFVKTLLTADAITTVSETYGLESQQVGKGFEVSFFVRQAAKVGKLTGIINGANVHRYNPEDPKGEHLAKWKDIDTGREVNLSYGPNSQDIMEKKAKIKEQLQKWVNKFASVDGFVKPGLPLPIIDLSKPLVTFIGRFDSNQKGIDKFEEAIKSTLKNGGQFICMGVLEDENATKILDALQAKYRRGVLFIRDGIDPKTKENKWQVGNAERPGLSVLVRAASDFILVPSSFEPCGLVQFEGWLFGSLAIGTETGGLADSIISIDKDKEHYNGFLCSNEKKQVGKIVDKALKFWSSQDKAKKAQTVQRLMKEGRQYAWTNKIKDLSSVEKYRFAYENAIEGVKNRNKSIESFDRIAAIRNCILLQKKQPKYTPDETYLHSFYYQQLDSTELAKLYWKVPFENRAQMPSPFGIKVNHTKHTEYGAFYDESSTKFCVYAPNAETVSLVLVKEPGSLTTEFPMAKDASGNWSANIPVNAGQKYQYKINGKIKIDPYGRQFAPGQNPNDPPYSIVTKSDYAWQDQEWMMQKDGTPIKSQPVSVYEFHPSAWKKNENGQRLNYRELAVELTSYCKKMGYTHLEFIGILDHPDEWSWGYKVGGYYAPNHRFGSLEDFKHMVDYLHQNKIGIILDWVPAHFSPDEFGLKEFDGTHQYEAHGLQYRMSRRYRELKFDSSHFDFKKKEVREFLISNAYFWINEMHIDGLRVDCVPSLLCSEDPDSALQLARDVNAVVHNECPGAFTVAEELYGDFRTTRGCYREGLDFDMKWHGGWRDVMFHYIEKPFEIRKKFFGELHRAVMCDNWHKQMMILDHDFTSKREKPLLDKVPNEMSLEEKYAHVRTMISYMMCLPGKKLTCMGTEYGSEKPWDMFLGKEKGMINEIDQIPEQGRQISNMVIALNKLYVSEPAFYEKDDNGHDVEWVDEAQKGLITYKRKSKKGNCFTCCHNFTDQIEKEYKVVIKKEKGIVYKLEEIFNSDSLEFGGKGNLNQLIALEERDDEIVYTIQVPPLSTVVVKEI